MSSDKASIRGIWYDPKHSQQTAACMMVTADQHVQVLAEQSQQRLAMTSLAQVSISSRLGNTPRHIYFADGQKFETNDNDAVDSYLLGKNNAYGNLLYRLESHWRLVIFSVVLLLAFVWGSVQYGLPLISKVVAYALPVNVSELAANQTLRVMDETMLSPTNLSSERQQALKQQFEPVLAREADVNWHIEFRHGGELGANAFALPGGTMVFTDEIVELAANDDELKAVLAHEMGHVMHRHGERSLIQNSLLVFLAMTITGDSSGIAEVFLGLPVLLVERAYSRDFEREADQYALTYLQANSKAPEFFVDLLERVALSSQCHSYFLMHPPEQNEPLNADICQTAKGLQKFIEAGLNQVEVPASKWMNYLSTHPDNAERRQQFVH